MDRGIIGSPLVGVVNKAFVALIDAPVLGGLLRKSVIRIRYVGRRSGRTIETPVGYRRDRTDPNAIVIGVVAPDKKVWWRNFLDDGAPITLVGLDGRDRTGHAVTHRDAQGRVEVRVNLT